MVTVPDSLNMIETPNGYMLTVLAVPTNRVLVMRNLVPKDKVEKVATAINERNVIDTKHWFMPNA